MAKFEFNAGDEIAIQLSRLADKQDEIAKKALYQAAKIVADKIKDNLKSLPEDTFRYLQENEQFKGVPESQKQDLIEHFGITPIDVDNKGNWNVKIGFDGYGSYKTNKYPKGLPIPLLARAIESGSSVRKKTPFIRPALRSVKSKAEEVMAKVVDKETEKIMKK